MYVLGTLVISNEIILYFYIPSIVIPLNSMHRWNLDYLSIGYLLSIYYQIAWKTKFPEFFENIVSNKIPKQPMNIKFY